MNERILELRKEIIDNLDKVENLEDLEQVKNNYLNMKGDFSSLLKKAMDEVDASQKKEMGMFVNKERSEVFSRFAEIKERLEKKALNEKLEKDAIDVTLPSTKLPKGTIHPINLVIEEVSELFLSMGYDIVEGPEVEEDLYNFELLNIPKGHPARDSQDSFFIDEEMLLRTQTSPVQAREMLANKEKTPIRIICPGKVYRKDNDDATHSHQFTQIEGLVIGKDLSMADLKGTLEILAKKMFGEERQVRFRPSYFPFTEPSVEVDISCFKCGGKGCSICKKTGWIEILGSGMVHPNVLKMSGYDPEIYSGFAFGMGPERIAMLKYGITDIREFYTNDIRFLETFNRVEGVIDNEN